MGRTPPGRTRAQVYRYVRERLLRGEPPTVREVQAALGFRAVETARAHLEALVAEGRLVKAPGRARGYRLPGTEGVTQVPLLGRVPAGPLDLAVEELEGYVPLPARRPGETLFALRIEGESLREAGILAGDVVVVRQQNWARSGELVVALVGEEATVKFYYPGRGRVELRPANRAFRPLRLRPEEVRLLGKVIEVRRSLEGGGA